jgi:hypothetical protein
MSLPLSILDPNPFPPHYWKTEEADDQIAAAFSAFSDEQSSVCLAHCQLALANECTSIRNRINAHLLCGFSLQGWEEVVVSSFLAGARKTEGLYIIYTQKGAFYMFSTPWSFLR